MYDSFAADFWATFPISLVCLVGLVVVVVDCFWNDSPWLPVISAAGVTLALVIESSRLGYSGLAFSELLRYGGLAAFMNMVVLLSAALSIVLSVPYLTRARHNFGEVYALICFATAGMMFLVSSNNLISIFIGLETMSICLYALTGLVREDKGATEGALKYFLLGAFSTGFFLYGIALIYGATGSMYLPQIAASVSIGTPPVIFWAGTALLLVGFLFKVSAVPFHMWTPDVYQAAPTTLTGYMATASKAAAFTGIVIVGWYALPSAGATWQLTLAIVALVTMVVGNVIAVSQNNVKRMLAYSSIAHAGYMLVGLAAASPAGYSGVLYYLLVYTLMNIGAFGVMAVFEWDDHQGREQTLESLAGVGLKRPVLGVSMAFFMFSLAGFPPLAGFIGKVRVFAPAIDAGMTWLVVVGVLTSAVSAYYYLRVLYYFFMKSPEAGVDPAIQKLPVTLASIVVLIICAASQLWFGLLPSGILRLTDGFFGAASMGLLP
ncbi:MAG TPA: NADH-quinone oxidoreductase subunit N [Rhodothermales bacterium]|nr:NADH-quinone oxidoreductase subunit N [Rhodothermales bacterium]